MAQVVGVQWLNPLQRRDYSTEWQLLWTLGLARPNKVDYMVETKPQKYLTIQSVSPVAGRINSEENFHDYHESYIRRMTKLFHSAYYSNPTYFYTVHSKNKKKWRELAGIHIEYALPAGRLDPVEAGAVLREDLINTFDIGNPHFPSLWTKSTPPDIRVTQGGPNVGFASLAAALDYLQTHPNETVWAMSWDAPSFPPSQSGLDQNMTLLVLAGPQFNTERAALAWIGYPASTPVAGFTAGKGQPSRAVQAWTATLEAAARNAGKAGADVGYVIHDANNRTPAASERIGPLAQMLSTELAEFDFLGQTFNTAALLGDMGAGSVLTNVALAIGYANHVGKAVLVAGTTDTAQPTAVVVLPPEKVRPVDPEKDWFRARGDGSVYLPWWGLRHDAPAYMQGDSE